MLLSTTYIIIIEKECLCFSIMVSSNEINFQQVFCMTAILEKFKKDTYDLFDLRKVACLAALATLLKNESGAHLGEGSGPEGLDPCPSSRVTKLCPLYSQVKVSS